MAQDPTDWDRRGRSIFVQCFGLWLGATGFVCFVSGEAKIWALVPAVSGILSLVLELVQVARIQRYEPLGLLGRWLEAREKNGPDFALNDILHPIGFVLLSLVVGLYQFFEKNEDFGLARAGALIVVASFFSYITTPSSYSISENAKKLIEQLQKNPSYKENNPLIQAIGNATKHDDNKENIAIQNAENRRKGILVILGICGTLLWAFGDLTFKR